MTFVRVNPPLQTGHPDSSQLTHAQLAGMKPAADVLTLVQLTQQHRGLTAAVLVAVRVRVAVPVGMPVVVVMSSAHGGQCGLRSCRHLHRDGGQVPGGGVQDAATAVDLGLLEYIPFPDALRGKYQCYTQADLAKLRAAGCDHVFADVQTGVAKYMAVLATAD